MTLAAADSFSRTLWDGNLAQYEAIVAMPFNVELAEGTLSMHAFRRYIIQDAHYLDGFARALALAAAKADSADQVAMLAGSAAGAIHVERSLHETYFQQFGVTKEEFTSTEPTPACSHYVSFLLATAALEPFPVAVVALLPCFWIYREVGQSIADRSAKDNTYRAWIDTYSGEAFDAAVSRMIALTDALAEAANEETRRRMAQAFAKSTTLEWMFWDSAYRDAKWPL
jgi:thiaminase/transcriptional activator TenA